MRRDADAAFQKNDVRNGMVLLGQIIAQAPDDSATWLRLARAIQQVRVVIDRDRTALLERAGTAAYIAYQRAKNRNEEADALVIVGRSFGDRHVWRPALDALRLSLELRETADVRALYEKMREDHGFRLLDYSVDADSASPRACFQFSEALPGKRTDFSPFVAVAGQDKLALSADDKQLCVEGLKHGERYSVTLRAGLPSTVKETLSKSADLTIYVRDRKPMARFAGKAYVLPRTGQRGIPLVSVNTKAVDIAVYRISDRNLIETVLGRDFQRNLYPYEIERLTESRGVKVWNGELAVEQTLNAEITTAFPVDQAIGDMAPGVYVMTAEAKGTTSDDYDSLSTQWFIVSDMGLAAYSGNDGINVFVNSLATTEPKGQVEVRLMSRGNEILCTKKTDAARPRRLRGRAVARRGRARARHAGRDRRQGRLRLPQSEGPGVRSERPRRQGPPGGGGARCLRLHRARRLSLRRDRACHVAVARRAGRGGAERAADARGRAAGRHRISPRRGARSGRRRPYARRADQRGGLDRHLARARLHRSEAPGGRRDHLPGRGLCPRPAGVRSRGAGRAKFPATRRPS